MRYLAPAPEFSLFAAAVILITLAVCPIGYAKAEKNSFVDSQKEKKSLLNEEIALKTKRSLKYKDANIGDHSPDHSFDKPLYFKKGGNNFGDDDPQYSPQSDALGSDGAGYESDGYGYDDDEYDHINYKRYDSDKDKLNQDEKMNKEESSLDKGALEGDSKANAPPEATTIELLSFQAKNLNSGSEGAQSGKDESKIKPVSINKPPYSEKDSKDSLVDENLKKKTNSEQKMDDMKTSGNTGNDKTPGNVKMSDGKAPDNKEGLYGKAEKAKVAGTEGNAQINVQNVKESVRAADAKDAAASASDDKSVKFEDLSKNEAKIVEKDAKDGDSKLQTDGKEEKDLAKVKEDKDMESAITETKAAESSKEEAREKNLSQLVSSQANLVSNDYKDGFDNINTPGIVDDEKVSEDLKENGINLAGLRDNRNELPYKYRDPGDGFHRSKYAKKEASDGRLRRKIGSRSNLASGIGQWDTDPLAKEDDLAKNALERGPKEPFRLDFPLADLENTDYHKNFIKSLKRFKGLDESSRILSQGDTPSPYADEAKKQLASKVIEEEQRKRRSRLRRLKADPIFASVAKRGRDGPAALNAYVPSSRVRMAYAPNGLDGSYGRGVQGYEYETSRLSPGAENIQGGGFSEDEGEITGPLGEEDLCDDEEYEDMTRNIKNKRRDTTGFYGGEIEGSAGNDEEEEEDGFAEDDRQRLSARPSKRKSQAGKNAWARSEYSGIAQKKKYSDLGSYEEPSGYNTPLLLLQRNNNGKQSMKTFTDGRYKNEDGIDSEDLARLLSRDSNYVVLKKVPGKEQVQKMFDSGVDGQGERAKAPLGDANKQEKLKASQLDLVVKAQRPVNTMDPDLRKVVELYKEARVEQPLKKKEDRIKDLSDFFKEHGHDKEIDEKKEILVSIDNRMSQYERGEPNKRLMYKPPLSQAYRHMKDFENSDGFGDAEALQRGLYDGKKNPASSPDQAYLGSERVMKSFKKEGKEVVLMNNQPFSPLAYKTKGQEGIQSNAVMNMLSASSPVPMSNLAPTNSMFAASNVVPNSNMPQAVGLLPNSNMLSNPSGMPNNYMMPNSNMQQNGFMQNNNNNPLQIKLPEISQKSSDINRKYFLYGPDNDISSSPKHEVKVIQSDFGVPQDNTQTYSLQNYNKPNPTKSTQSGKATPLNLAPGQGQNSLPVFSMMQKSNAYDYGKANAQQQCMANGHQGDKKAADLKENIKKVSKKESEGRQLSTNLKRFMRDFQGLDRAYQPGGNDYIAKDLSGMSLQELTSHGGRQFQKLNNLLKEIMNNKVEVSGNEVRKNTKRGMFPKSRDLKSWQFGAESAMDPQVRSDKGTSVVFDSSNEVEFANRNSNISPDGPLFKEDGDFDSTRIADVEAPQNTYGKRMKRESPYDGSRDSTKALEVKVKSTPYTVQLQPLNPMANAKANANSNANANTNTNANANANANSNPNSNPNTNTNANTNSNTNPSGNTYSNQQQKSTARASLQLPPDKLLDLMNFMASGRNDRRGEETRDSLCRRQAPFVEAPSNPPFRRKLLSVNENEPEPDSKRVENIRKSFESYLDPLVQKISGHENKSQNKSKRSARSKRQIELDESMPNDFQNFLVTSLGGFGNQKREVVKKEEALWQKEGARDDSSQIVDATGNPEPNEESILGKRDTSRNGKRTSTKDEDGNKSKNEKKSVAKGNEATNIRIRIVDVNPAGELASKASEDEKNQFAGRSAAKDESLGASAPKNEGGERQSGPGIRELYLITNKDSKKRKKKKFANPRSDQAPQKQPISNHLPQVETVYNPSPGSNKAQIEKISSNDAQMKMKCLAKPTNAYNATASMIEDNIIRNNLRTGNINTFTYQRKEEPTPYPLRNPTNPPTSNEFEMLDSKNPSRSKPLSSRLVGSSDRFAGSSLTNANPEIVYKDEASQQYSNIMNGAKPVFSKQGYRSYNVPALAGERLRTVNSGVKARVYESGLDISNADNHQKDYAEEDSSYTEYSDPEEANYFSDPRLNHRVDSDYEARDAAGTASYSAPGQGIRRQDAEDRPYARAQDNLNPKMIEMWNNYARTHLTPATHKEAMNREFREAYLKTNLGREANTKLAGLASCISADTGAAANVYSAPDEHDHDGLTRDNRDIADNLGSLDERLTKAKKRSGPVQIGRRFFYTFKTEVPDEEFYALITEPVKLKSANENSKVKVSEGNREEKKSGRVQASNRQQPEKVKQKTEEAVKQNNGEDVLENVIGSYIVRKRVSDDGNGCKIEEDKPGARRKRNAEVHQPGNDLVGHRVERSGEGTKSSQESKLVEKRMSSGHLTESHYKKYHRKNFNNRRDAEDVPEPDFCPKTKRDAVSDAVRADMMKRIQEEKKARSMVKNLKMDLAKSEAPLIGPGMVPVEDTLPSEMLRLEEEKRRNKIVEENRFRDDQQHSNNARPGSGTGTPDIYRTFEIKRGRRCEPGNRAREKDEHSRVSRSEPDSYRDRVFLKGVRARKVKKYLDEGFEPITPDLRFSEKSNVNYFFDNRESKAADEGPFRAMPGERSVTSVANGKAEERSKVKESASANAPKQKLTHGFSHEAPLLTLASPLGQPSSKVAGALKASPIANPKSDLKAFAKHPSEAVFLGTLNGNLQKGNHAFKIAKLEEESKKSDPLVGAVLVLAKRDKTKKRHARDQLSHAGARPGRDTNRDTDGEDEYEGEASARSRLSGTAKRSQDWRESGGISDLPNSDQSAEIVIDSAECRSCGGDTETKTCNQKQTNNFKQSPFPFSQSHNMNTDRNGVGNSGEDILESILGRVESNPHFRKVIGPGLKWRDRKCYFDGEDRHRCCYSPPNRNLFVRQVRKILAKFVNDIEKLAAQDMRRNPCCKLDGRSNRFLHELLEVPFESNEDSMQSQYKFQLDPILRGRGAFGADGQSSNITSADAKNMDPASVEAMQNRRQLVLRLLGEYENLSEDDRKKVEVLGQYLIHELEVLNAALRIKEEGRPKEEVSESAPASATTMDKKCEERSTSAATQGTEACREDVTFATESAPTTEKDLRRATMKIPFIWTNPEDVKFLKSGYQVRSDFKPEQISSSSGLKIPNAKDFGVFSTSPMEAGFPEIATDNPEPVPMTFSKINLSSPKLFSPPSASRVDDETSKYEEWGGGFHPGNKAGELHKLGYGDAAGLQLSLKSHGPWFSNLDLGKAKPLDIWQRSKTFGLPVEQVGNGVTDLPHFREDSADAPQFNNPRDALSEEDSDGLYDLEYQDYDDDDDAYEAQSLKGWKRRV